MTTSTIQDWRTRSQAHGFMAFGRPGDAPEVIFEKGKGVILTDVNGKEYMDLCSFFHCTSLGYGREDIAAVAFEEMKKLSFTPNIGLYNHPPGIEYAEALSAFSPKNINHFFFCNSGSEANEVNLKLAKAYWFYQGKPQKYKMISLMEGYHGLTDGTKGMLGDYALREPFGYETPYGLVRVPNYNCYRCHLERTYHDCGIACARYLEKVIDEEGENSIAAYFAEPILGYGGAITPPPEYFPMVREILTRRNILMIDDEVMSGFCRTGKNFCVDHWGVEPDLMALAKGMTGVYFPVAGIGVSDKVFEVLKDKFFMAGQTTSGHPVGMAVAKKCLEIYHKEKTTEHVTKLGNHLRARLEKEFLPLPNIGDVGGLGLMQAIEVVADKETKRRFPVEKDIMHNVVLPKCLEAGIMPRVYSSIRHDRMSVAPPLIITKEELDKGLDILYPILADLKNLKL